MIRAVIIEDEPVAVELLTSIIAHHCPEVEITGTAAEVEKGIHLIRTENPDLLFLDIQLRDGTAFDVLRRINSDQHKIIFVTAFEEYAITAFRFSAIDYLMKPVNPDELIHAVKKAMNTLETETMSRKLEVLYENLDHNSRSERKIVLRTSSNLHIIRIQDIIRCQSDKNYTQFFLTNGTMISVARTLKEYEDLLARFRFIRVHQSHLVNVNHIRRYEKINGGFIVLSDETHIPVSFRKKEDFMRLIGQLHY